jgi:Family of unknown function (DUF6152)
MRRFQFALLAFVVASVPAIAHHGWGSYNAETPITISAEISDVTISNPHGMMMLMHENAQWMVTLAPPSRMQVRGATPDLLANGKNITAYGYPKRDGTKEIRAEWIEIDGKRIQLR